MSWAAYKLTGRLAVSVGHKIRLWYFFTELISKFSQLSVAFVGSIENEDPENKDRRPKTPKNENEDPKTRKRRPGNTKTKTPNHENEDPKTRKRRPLNTKTKTLKHENEDPETLKRRPPKHENEAPPKHENE